MSRLILVLIISLSGALIVKAQPNQLPNANQSVEKAADDNNDELLIKAIKSGNLGQVKNLLDKGVSPEVKDEGSPVICVAIRSNQSEIAELLLARGAKVDQEEGDEGTALQIAAAAGRANLAKLLIAHGADVNHNDHDGHPPLLCAAFGAMWKGAPDWIVTQLFKMDDDDEEDENKLREMLGNEHLAVAKLLLAAGAQVNAKGGDCGLTALMIAAMSGNAEMARLLLDHHADVRIAGYGEHTALEFAERYDSPEELANELREQDDEKEKQALLNWVHFTASGRHTVAAMLRNAGAKR